MLQTSTKVWGINPCIYSETTLTRIGSKYALVFNKSDIMILWCLHLCWTSIKCNYRISINLTSISISVYFNRKSSEFVFFVCFFVEKFFFLIFPWDSYKQRLKMTQHKGTKDWPLCVGFETDCAEHARKCTSVWVGPTSGEKQTQELSITNQVH